MKCKVCDKSFQISLIRLNTTKAVAEEMKVCGVCQRRIIEMKPDWGKKLERKVFKCVICGKEASHHNIHETCGNSSCRGKWYKQEEDKKIISNSIEINNFDKIGHLKLSRIELLGFTVKSENQIIVIGNTKEVDGS